jgi:hypothetical protein
MAILAFIITDHYDTRFDVGVPPAPHFAYGMCLKKVRTRVWRLSISRTGAAP